MTTIIIVRMIQCITFQAKTIHSPKHNLQKLCQQGRLLGSDKISEHKEHVSRSLISSTATLSDTTFAMILVQLRLYYFKLWYQNIYAFIKRNNHLGFCQRYNESVAGF